MPYRWNFPEEAHQPVRLRIWPHQSLTPEGFVWFIAPTALLFLLPLVAMLGSLIMWILLFFFACTMSAIWWAIMANRRHRMIEEELCLWPDRAVLRHQQPGKEPLFWEANPYWIRLEMKAEGGPVENYLTLKGGDRTVEIGAFLSAEERALLRRELEDALGRLRQIQ